MKISTHKVDRLRKKCVTLFSSTVILLFFFIHSPLRPISESDDGAHKIVNPHPFKWLIVEKDLCNTPENDLEILALVLSAPHHFELRMSVRETWGSKQLYPMIKTKLAFALGWTPDASLQAAIKNESNIYHDIIQEDFLDSYRNLTYKSIMCLKFVSEYCAQAKYLLKTDDDMIVNIFDIVDLLRQKKNESKSIFGYIHKGKAVQRDPENKWYITREELAQDTYSTYCSGSLYIIPSEFCRLMYEQSFYTRFMWIEDWYITGALVEALHFKHTNISHMYALYRNYSRIYEKLDAGSASVAHINDTAMRSYYLEKFLLEKGIQFS